MQPRTDGQTDRQTPGLSSRRFAHVGTHPKPICGAARGEKPLCERERKRKGKGKRLSLLWTKQKPQMIRNAPQRPTDRQTDRVMANLAQEPAVKRKKPLHPGAANAPACAALS